MADLPPERPPSPEFETKTWPPIWKPLEESPQFEYGLLQPYLKVEHDLQQYDTNTIPYSQNNMLILEFLRKVRKSRGYDIDFCPPEFESFPLKPMPFRVLMGDDEHMHELTAFVVAKINSRSKMYGEVYEFVEMKNLVHSGGHRLSLMTFSVKEVNTGQTKLVQAMLFPFQRKFKLYDLRFKPEAAATPHASVHSSA